MDKKVQLSAVLALSLHGVLLFGISPPSGPNIARTETEKPHVTVDLVEAKPVEEPPPPPPEPEPEPPVVPPPPIIEQEPPPPPPEPEPHVQPEPVAVPQPVESISVEQALAAPAEAEFKVAATTNQNVPVVEEIVPVAPPPVVVPQDIVVKAQARYRKNPEPPYPLQAKRRRQEGLVLLRVLLDQRGLPTKVEIKESSGFTLLDNAAQETIRSWEFEPAVVNNQTVASEVEVPVRFKLSR